MRYVRTIGQMHCFIKNNLPFMIVSLSAKAHQWFIMHASDMIFSYYNKLSAANKRIYQQSDGIIYVPLPDAGELQPLIPLLSAALAEENREQVEDICRKLVLGIARQLSAPPLRVKVLAVRPSASWGELHGLYEPANGMASAVIALWIRTAKQRRVVAFKSFLRTLLHELCHHLDYELYRMPDSFHTEGFYKRESSLFHQLIPEARQSVSAE
jgi:hypothetical protein